MKIPFQDEVRWRAGHLCDRLSVNWTNCIDAEIRRETGLAECVRTRRVGRRYKRLEADLTHEVLVNLQGNNQQNKLS